MTHALAAVALAAASLLPAAGGYGTPTFRCGFADTRINESSGVASASWSPEVIWTHNDSGDVARFFAVDAKTCATLGTYTVDGAEAVDWEDMARSDGTLHLADIGDNLRKRPSVTVYDVAEPARGAPDGAVAVAARRVFTYPDGAHDAETLFTDPTTGRLVVVTKETSGLSTVYRAPAQGDGTLERVADVQLTGLIDSQRLVTSGDATKGRLVLRTYLSAAEWEIRSGDTLAAALARPPAAVAMPITPQGEAISYTADGDGLWLTSESEHGPVHRVDPAAAPGPIRPQGVAEERVLDRDSGPGAAVFLAGGATALLAVGALAALSRRGRRLG